MPRGDTIMSAAPTEHVSSVPPTESVEARFRQLESKWMAEVGHLSSYTAIVRHPAFQEIISLGEAVVPFMLQDLQERPRLWVWALPEITGADPITPGDGGN